MGTTLAEKVWADHLVRKGDDGAPDLLYIDLMLMHEVTSPQAFEGLRLAGRKPRHIDQLIATEDHNTPTVDIDKPNPDETSSLQLTTLEKNCKEFGVRLHPLGDADQGVVHAFAPVLGLTQPGMTIVCGDSHTSTHGAFGALAFGIGTSEVEHVMATQTLSLKPFKTMAVNIEGELPKGVTAKDIILAIIAKIGTGGGQGYVIEYRGEALKKLSMDARMTICNMSIEAGARAGMIAPDEVTFEYLKGRPHAPEGDMWDKAVEYWKTLKTDDDAVFDKEVTIKAEDLEPYVTWGTNPGQGAPISATVPDPESIADETERNAGTARHRLHGSEARHGDQGHRRRHRVHRLLHEWPTRRPARGRIHYEGPPQGREHPPCAGGAGIVPRSACRRKRKVSTQIFKDFGAEWRNAGCSMCLGMNPDKMVARERSISTSNRNFEGRQGKGSGTHLASPAVAAATAIRGTISSPADL